MLQRFGGSQEAEMTSYVSTPHARYSIKLQSRSGFARFYGCNSSPESADLTIGRQSKQAWVKTSHGVYTLQFMLAFSNQRWRKWESQSPRQFWCSTAGIRWRRPPGKKRGQPLEAGSGLPWTASKEMTTSVLQPPWTEFYQTRRSRKILVQSLRTRTPSR